MSLFSIETAPVPLNAETYLGEKREYTQIILETELIALTENNYIPLTQAQILLCAKIGYMYYCEYAHLLKKRTEHTSMSAIYYDQGSDIKVKQCKTIITFDTIPESKCKAEPCCASLGYPFHNTAAHTEATPTREGI